MAIIHWAQTDCGVYVKQNMHAHTHTHLCKFFKEVGLLPLWSCRSPSWRRLDPQLQRQEDLLRRGALGLCGMAPGTSCAAISALIDAPRAQSPAEPVPRVAVWAPPATRGCVRSVADSGRRGWTAHRLKRYKICVRYEFVYTGGTTRADAALRQAAEFISTRHGGGTFSSRSHLSNMCRN